jgi:hypothetical protein
MSCSRDNGGSVHSVNRQGAYDPKVSGSGSVTIPAIQNPPICGQLVDLVALVWPEGRLRLNRIDYSTEMAATS